MRVAPPNSSRLRRGFTLIEIMIVVGIIGLIMGMGVPTLFQMLHRSGLPKMVDDVMELCRQARARAIMQGVTVKIVFHPQERRCELAGGAALAGAPGKAVGGVAFEDNVMIEMLDVNLREYKDEDEVGVRFFQNGTSDEMMLILRSDKNEKRGIMLEITTGVASALSESELQRIAYGSL
jgi:prepilin-type N-terminal cleavage/methylation domain-containing protein